MSTKRERTRLRILESASKLLVERGAAHVRMEDVAQAADLTRQTVYLYFSTRTELMVALMDHIPQQRGLGHIFAVIEDAPDARQMLLRGLSAHATLMAHVHDVALALDVARFDDEAAAAAWNNRAKLRDEGVARIVGRLKAEGGLAPGWSASEVVDALAALLCPGLLRDFTRDSGRSLRDYERFLHAAASGFLAPAPPATKPSGAPSASGRNRRRPRST